MSRTLEQLSAIRPLLIDPRLVSAAEAIESHQDDWHSGHAMAATSAWCDIARASYSRDDYGINAMRHEAERCAAAAVGHLCYGGDAGALVARAVEYSAAADAKSERIRSKT